MTWPASYRNSYADLEKKVEERTEQLAQSVAELRALGEISQTVNSTLDLETVLNTIVSKATQLAGTEAGAIYVYDQGSKEFRLRATYGMSDELLAAMEKQHSTISHAVGLLTTKAEPQQVPDLRDTPPDPVNEMFMRAGYRARLLVPLIAPDGMIGALVVRRRAAASSPRTPSICYRPSPRNRCWRSKMLGCSARSTRRAASSKSRASTSRSSSPTSSSHELRTPLNAILGYTELILDSIYGEVPDKARGTLERIQANGKHLLGLINDVLDLSKIEAGQLILSLADYSIKDVVHNVYGAVESLATSKNLAFKIELPKDLPQAHGDERRLAQVCSTSWAMRSSSPTPARSRSAPPSPTEVSPSRCTTPVPASPSRIRSRSSKSFSKPTPRSQSRKAAPGWGLPLPSGSSRCTVAGSGSNPKLARGRLSRSACRSMSNSR